MSGLFVDESVCRGCLKCATTAPGTFEVDPLTRNCGRGCLFPSPVSIQYGHIPNHNVTRIQRFAEFCRGWRGIEIFSTNLSDDFIFSWPIQSYSPKKTPGKAALPWPGQPMSICKVATKPPIWTLPCCVAGRCCDVF